MSHVYDDTFFEWVDNGALRSAAHLLPVVLRTCEIGSVVDVGCGRAAWLSVWRSLGVLDVLGLDGDYVDRAKLKIPEDRFVAADLGGLWQVPRRFDLAQSLEVAEHLPSGVAAAFVRNLCSLADVVMFSAAVPGQGGEMHVNEREPEWWAALFASQGFAMFDALRDEIVANDAIEPWYRYNTFIYANAKGQGRLSTLALQKRVPEGAVPRAYGSPSWRLRRMVLSPLPPELVTFLSRLNYRRAVMWRSVCKKKS